MPFAPPPEKGSGRVGPMPKVSVPIPPKPGGGAKPRSTPPSVPPVKGGGVKSPPKMEPPTKGGGGIREIRPPGKGGPSGPPSRGPVMSTAKGVSTGGNRLVGAEVKQKPTLSTGKKMW